MALFHCVDGANQLPQVLRHKRLGRRPLLQRTAIADKDQQLSEGGIFWNLYWNSLHELFTGFCSYVSLHFDFLPAPNLGSIESYSFECAGILSIGGGDIQSDAVQLHVIKTAGQK